MLKAAAHLIFKPRKSDHMTPLGQDLLSLYPESIDFRLAVLVYRCLHYQHTCHCELYRVAD